MKQPSAQPSNNQIKDVLYKAKNAKCVEEVNRFNNELYNLLDKRTTWVGSEELNLRKEVANYKGCYSHVTPDKWEKWNM